MRDTRPAERSPGLAGRRTGTTLAGYGVGVAAQKWSYGSMHYTLSARAEDVKPAAAELHRLGLNVDIHPRLPRERSAVVSVFDVAPPQEHLVARIATRYHAQFFPNGDAS